MNGIIAGLPGAQYSLGVYSIQQGFFRDLRRTIKEAIKNGAKIINMSNGGISCGSPLGPNICGDCYKEKEFIDRKTDWEEIFDKYPNVLFVAAAGNSKIPAIFNLPGGGVSRPNLIAVAATTTNKDNKDDKGHPTYPWMEYSNGWKNDAKTNNDKEGIDIAAPGEHVYAPNIYTAPLDYQDYDADFRNTSAAAPIVTGVAAMMMAVSENALTSSEIKDILWETADPPCKPGERAGCLINPFAAVAYAITGGPPSTKFSIDDGVEISPDANMNLAVWNEPNGTVIGTQVPGARGTVVGGPRYSSTKIWLWRVDFESGADGWVVEEYLRKVDANYTDLTSQSLTVNGTLANGSTVTFTGAVKNSGTAPITTAFTDNFTYRWGTSGAWTQFGEHIPKTVPFAAGATQTDTSANFTPNSTGTLQVQHCIDSQGQLAESDETNNCTVQTYTVGAAVNYCGTANGGISRNPPSLNLCVSGATATWVNQTPECDGTFEWTCTLGSVTSACSSTKGCGGAR